MPFLHLIQLQATQTCDGYILEYQVTVSKVNLNIYTICPCTENKSHSESTSFSLLKQEQDETDNEKKKRFIRIQLNAFFMCAL